MRGRPFKKSDYKKVKVLLDAGVKPSQIKDITDWSAATVYQVRNTSTHEEYIALNHKRLPHYQKQPKVVQENNTPTKEDKLDMIIDLLRDINNSLNKQEMMF